MIELHNNTDVKEVLFSTTLGLISGTDPTCKLQLHSLPNMFLKHTAFFLCISAGILQSLPEWAHI